VTISAFRGIFTGVTTTQSAPTDATVPSLDTSTGLAPNGIRGTQFLIECELYGTSGTVTATVDLYCWDSRRAKWAKTGTSLSLSSTQTSSVPAARTIYALDSIGTYEACMPVISAISGTGATCSVAMALNGP
jgi:hypothetical protein